MSKRTISTFVAAILFIANFSVEAQAQEEKTEAKTAKIEFVKTVHDYGTIFQGANGECEFEFKNVGKEPLVLSNVRSSCGCTVPSWPKEPIMPGKTGSITVKYNTERLGAISKTVTVISNAEDVTLRIAGQVKQKQDESLPEKQQSPMQQNNN